MDITYLLANDFPFTDPGDAIAFVAVGGGILVGIITVLAFTM